MALPPKASPESIATASPGSTLYGLEDFLLMNKDHEALARGMHETRLSAMETGFETVTLSWVMPAYVNLSQMLSSDVRASTLFLLQDRENISGLAGHLVSATVP